MLCYILDCVVLYTGLCCVIHWTTVLCYILECAVLYTGLCCVIYWTVLCYTLDCVVLYIRLYCVVICVYQVVYYSAHAVPVASSSGVFIARRFLAFPTCTIGLVIEFVLLFCLHTFVHVFTPSHICPCWYLLL